MNIDNIDYVRTLRGMVARQAVDLNWRTIPRLQVPFVEYVVPIGEDAEKALTDMQLRLAGNPNFKAKLIVKDAQIRVRMEYRA